MENLIKELNELQATLKADGYKDWCYAQLTIGKAIKAVKNCTIPLVSNAKRTICHCTEPKFKENVQGDFLCHNCGKP
jgi:hypothetical protein